MSPAPQTSSDPVFKFDAPGIDSAAIVAQVRATVDEKIKQRVYTDSRVGLAERTNLANLKDDEQYLSFYLECLRDAVYVDISDFEIYEQRPRFKRFWITLKRGIWSLLRFYTYRLWSQQNQVNGLLLSAVDTLEERYRLKIEKLETRVAELEKRLPPGQA